MQLNYFKKLLIVYHMKIFSKNKQIKLIKMNMYIHIQNILKGINKN